MAFRRRNSKILCDRKLFWKPSDRPEKTRAEQTWSRTEFAIKRSEIINIVIQGIVCSYFGSNSLSIRDESICWSFVRLFIGQSEFTYKHCIRYNLSDIRIY